MDHLDDNAASEFASGSLLPSMLAKVEGHLASCRDCRALVAALAADPGEDSDVATFEHGSQVTELPARPLTVGDRVDRYLVLAPLGAGGMGVVFAAWDPQLGRKIALKLLRSGLPVSAKDARARLRREAQAIAQLSHPNVVSIYDVGTTDDGDLYIAMEFVEGDTLTRWLRAYPRTWREIVEVFLQAARGLASAHGVGLLHRDFKPDNVLVGGDGRVRVTDFGLARSVLAPAEVAAKPVMTSLDVELTATGTVLGTPRYMPPEQMTGHDLDARSDQFSFCVALYEALYGSHPLPGGTSLKMIDHGDEALPPPDGSKVPVAVGRAVVRGLARDRARRHASMSALIADLAPRPARSPVRYATFGLAALLVVGGTTAAMIAKRPDPPNDERRIRVLLDEKDRKEAEVRALLVKLEQSRVDHDELVRLREALAKKTEEIRRLEETVSQMERVEMLPVPVIKKPARTVGPTQGILALGALAEAQRSVEGCFDEWAERRQGTREEVSEATLVVVLTVTPDGIGTLPKIMQTPDEHPVVAEGELGMSVLELCVSEQIVRVKFPAGPDQLELEATVLWSQGLVNVSPRVLRHLPAPRHEIELP